MLLYSTKQLPLVSGLQRRLQIVDKTVEFKVINNVLLLKVLMKVVNISHNDCMWCVDDRQQMVWITNMTLDSKVKVKCT